MRSAHRSLLVNFYLMLHIALQKSKLPANVAYNILCFGLWGNTNSCEFDLIAKAVCIMEAIGRRSRDKISPDPPPLPPERHFRQSSAISTSSAEVLQTFGERYGHFEVIHFAYFCLYSSLIFTILLNIQRMTSKSILTKGSSITWGNATIFNTKWFFMLFRKVFTLLWTVALKTA